MPRGLSRVFLAHGNLQLLKKSQLNLVIVLCQALECFANEKKLEICFCDCNFGPPPTSCRALDETFAIRGVRQLLFSRTHAQCDSTRLHEGFQSQSAKSSPIISRASRPCCPCGPHRCTTPRTYSAHDDFRMLEVFSK